LIENYFRKNSRFCDYAYCNAGLVPIIFRNSKHSQSTSLAVKQFNRRQSRQEDELVMSVKNESELLTLSQAYDLGFEHGNEMARESESADAGCDGWDGMLINADPSFVKTKFGWDGIDSSDESKALMAEYVRGCQEGADAAVAAIDEETKADPNIIQINLSSLTDAVIEYIESVDRLQCHIHLRIDAEGNAYCDEDAGYCVSHDEYNRVPGHVRTVKHQQGHGQCNLDDLEYTGWKDTDEGIEEINSMIETVIEDLERDGFKVELI
jgi:hypothetical protein